MEKTLEEYSVSAKADPSEVLLHKLFEKNAALTPDKTALISCDKQLTFKELNEEANRIAASLTESSNVLRR